MELGQTQGNDEGYDDDVPVKTQESAHSIHTNNFTVASFFLTIHSLTSSSMYPPVFGVACADPSFRT